MSTLSETEIRHLSCVINAALPSYDSTLKNRALRRIAEMLGIEGWPSEAATEVKR